MPQPKKRRKETTDLEQCPLCHDRDHLIITNIQMDNPVNPGAWDECEADAEFKCTGCGYEFSATSESIYWKTEILDTVKYEADIRTLLTEHGMTPSPGNTLARKLIYGRVLQLLANEALEAAQAELETTQMEKAAGVFKAKPLSPKKPYTRDEDDDDD